MLTVAHTSYLINTLDVHNHLPHYSITIVQLRFSSSGQFIHRRSARIFSTVNERGEDIHIGISQGQEQTSPDILSSAVND